MKDVKPINRRLVNRTAISILAAYALTTAHHIYGGLDGAPNRLRVPFIMAVPSLVALGALRRYKQTGSEPALATAGSVTVLAWGILSGIVHGGYAHAYKDILFLLDGPPQLYYPLNPDEHYPPDDAFFEVTGVLETVTGFFVTLFMYRLIRAGRQGENSPSARGQAISPR